MKNKITSLLLILLIYLVSLFLGTLACLITIYYIDNVILVILIGDLVTLVIVYAFSIAFNNSSIYDPYWSVIPIFLFIGFIYFTEASINFYIVIVFISLLIWSIRLTINWIMNFSNLYWEDFRYLNYRKKYKKSFQLINFFGIMFTPTLITFLTSLPIYYLIIKEVNVTYIIIGVIVILTGICFELVSDLQLKIFKKKKTKPCIDTGLWKYSRHPNYFGEILIWVGLFITSLNNFSYYSVIGIVVVILLFYFISIPLMEKHLLETKKEYLEYKKVVKSKLIPLYWRKKNG